MPVLPYRTAFTIAQVKANNTTCGQHFFDRGTMRFFNSRVVGTLMPGKRFVTSEKGPDGVRRYTVRRAVQDGCKIETVGEFQGYRSVEAARRAARSR